MIDSFDADGKCLLWNRECVKHLGWTHDEIKAAPDPLALSYPDPKVRDELLKTIQRADGVFREYKPLAKNGNTRTQMWADFLLPDKTKISVGYDITDSKRAARALEESEEKYRAIFSEARDGIVLADRDGFIIDCNPEFERQTGRKIDELRKMRTWDLRPPAQVAKAERLFDELRQRGVIDVSEQVFCKPNGEQTPVELRGRAITVGGKTFTQAITRDITKRKQTEDALRERDKQLRLLVGQIPAILWTTDRELRFTSSQGAGLRSLSLEEGQVVGMTIYEYFGVDDPDMEAIAMHRRVLEGESVRYETELEGCIFESHIEPLRNAEGEIIGCLGIALDVTEGKKAEKKLRSSEQQLRALASRLQEVREEESANIAREIHDELGQTLTGLKMDISWVRRRIAEMAETDLCSQVGDRLASMSDEVDETIQTVRRISTQLRPVILDDLGLTRALEWQAQEFENRTGITCDFGVDDHRSPLDPDRSTAVFRIFQEILTNVARHAAANNVKISLRSDNGLLVLDVRDDGKGISEEQISSSRALGILGMQERAQVCGGNVVIRRDNGGGTRVTVEVPME